MRGKVLVVDDQLRARRILVEELRDAEFEVCEAGDGRAGFRAFEEHAPDVVITDIVMPAEDGLTLLERIRETSDVPILLFTAFGTAQIATHAFKAGADDFICVDEANIEDIVERISDAVAASKGADRTDLSRRLVGSSPILRRLRDRIAGAAPLNIPILLSGGPGTGKSLIISMLHDMGPAPDGELLILRSGAARPPTDSSHTTVVLERIDEYSQGDQDSWRDEVEKASQVGFSRSPRIVASTTSRLAELKRDRQFMNGIGRALIPFALELPLLSEIRDDIPAIAQAMALSIGARLGRRATLSPAALALLRERNWAENAAELYRVLERSASFSAQPKIDVPLLESIFLELDESLDSIRARDNRSERERLLIALNEHAGNISRTAESLGKSRASIYRMIEKHHIPLRRTAD